MKTGKYNERAVIQALFTSLDSCSEWCAEMEHQLVEMEESAIRVSCISLSRDFIDLGHMLGAFIQRESLFAIKIAELLHEIALKLCDLLSRLGSHKHKITAWVEQLTLCATKITSYCASENYKLTTRFKI